MILKIYQDRVQGRAITLRGKARGKASEFVPRGKARGTEATTLIQIHISYSGTYLHLHTETIDLKGSHRSRILSNWIIDGKDIISVILSQILSNPLHNMLVNMEIPKLSACNDI